MNPRAARALAVTATALTIFAALALITRSAAPAPTQILVAAVAPPPPPAPARPPPSAVVVEVAGTVERLRGGTWTRVERGERLVEQDALRTAQGSRADLQTGDRSRIVVQDSTQITVRALDDAMHRFKVNRGRVGVAYAGASTKTVRVESEDGTAVVEATSADFDVLGTHESFAVASTGGEVVLRSAGTEVKIAPGEGSVAHREQAPSAPRPLPRELLLRVAAASSAGCSEFEGKAEPGSEVTVDAQPAALGADGRFRVRLASARSAVEVRSRNAAGLLRSVRLLCARTDTAAIDDVQIRWRK